MTATQTCKPAAEYRTDAPRVDGWTAERQAMFLMTLAQTGKVSFACGVVRMSSSSAYELRREARGTAFNLGWHAANLIARDQLEDRLLEAAIDGVDSISVREGGVTRRRVLNPGLSMAMLTRLDQRLTSLDDQSAAASRAIGAAFDDFIALVLDSGGAAEINAYLAQHPDPLAAQIATAARAKAGGADSAAEPQLVEESAIPASAATRVAAVPAPFTMTTSAPEPCTCPGDRELAVMGAV